MSGPDSTSVKHAPNTAFVHAEPSTELLQRAPLGHFTQRDAQRRGGPLRVGCHHTLFASITGLRDANALGARRQVADPDGERRHPPADAVDRHPRAFRLRNDDQTRRSRGWSSDDAVASALARGLTGSGGMANQGRATRPVLAAAAPTPSRPPASTDPSAPADPAAASHPATRRRPARVSPATTRVAGEPASPGSACSGVGVVAANRCDATRSAGNSRPTGGAERSAGADTLATDASTALVDSIATHPQCEL